MMPIRSAHKMLSPIDIDQDTSRLGTGSGRGLDRGHPLGSLADLFPQLLLSGAGFGGERDNACGGILLFKGAQRSGQLIAGEPVAFGGNYKEVMTRSAEEFQQLPVALLGRNVRVHQRNT